MVPPSSSALRRVRVMVSGEVSPVSEGTAVLFPQGAVHMLHNTGSEEMKVVCFFAPATIWIIISLLKTWISPTDQTSMTRLARDSRMASRER